MSASSVSIFSFFSGAGFLDLGFEKAGFNMALVNELSDQFLSGYKFSRCNMGIDIPKYGFDQSDLRSYFRGKEKERITDLVKDSKKNGGLVGFIGGPPCPDFSIGGLNNGRHGPAGQLSSCYVNLIAQQKPDFFLFENVKGLYKTKKHREYFEELKLKLQKCGYVTSEQVLNALEYGAPQFRERLIFVGFKSELLRKKSYSGNTLNEDFINWDKEKSYSMADILKCSWPDQNPFFEFSKVRQPEKIISDLAVQSWFAKNQVKSHPNSRHYFNPKSTEKFLFLPEGDLGGKSFKRLHRWKYSPTACYGNNEVHLHPYEARRISAAEALAIQSLPKDFILPPTMSLTDMFKTIGNGVPYLASKGVARTVDRVISDFI